MSEGRACRVLEQPRSSQCYRLVAREDDAPLIQAAVKLASRFGRTSTAEHRVQYRSSFLPIVVAVLYFARQPKDSDNFHQLSPYAQHKTRYRSQVVRRAPRLRGEDLGCCNVVQARSFAAMLEDSFKRDQNWSLETAQVINELIDLAK